jgi:hypothetical protein
MTRGASRGPGRPERRRGRRDRIVDGGALAALEFAGVRGEAVLSRPTRSCGHHRWRSWRRAAARSSSTATAPTSPPRCSTSGPSSTAPAEATSLVHIGGHIAFRCGEITLGAPPGRLPHRGLPRSARAVERAPGPGPGATRAFYRSTPRDRFDGRAAYWSPVATTCSSSRPIATTANPTTGSPDWASRRGRVHGRTGTRQTERMEHIVAARTPSPAAPRPAHPGRLELPTGWSRPVQVHRLRRDQALDRQGLCGAVPHIMGTGDERPTATGSKAPLVRAALPPGHERATPGSRPGGAGFIGSPSSIGCSRWAWPRIFDLRPSPHHGDGVDTVLGDLLDRDLAARRGGDAVVHRRRGGRRRRRTPPRRRRAVNARHATCWEAARGSGVRQVVYAAHRVYGSCTGTVDEDHAVELPDHLTHKLAGRCTLPLVRGAPAWTARCCASASRTARAREPGGSGWIAQGAGRRAATIAD